MSETKHSPEPWKAATYYGDEGGAFDGIDDARLNTVIGEHGPSEEDRDRIVACVNACAGIPTDALESGALGRVLSALDEWGKVKDDDDEMDRDVIALNAARVELRGFKP